MITLLKKFIKEVLSEPSGNVRGTATVRSNDGTHTWEEIDDTLGESTYSDVGRLAACVLVQNAEGQFLAVSRKNNPGDFGLPGGKVDAGETPVEAAVRELREETGLSADINSMKLVFVADDGEYATYTYVGNVNGEVLTSEPGVVQWVSADELLRGSFADYNRQLFRKLGIR